MQNARLSGVGSRVFSLFGEHGGQVVGGEPVFVVRKVVVDQDFTVFGDHRFEFGAASAA